MVSRYISTWSNSEWYPSCSFFFGAILPQNLVSEMILNEYSNSSFGLSDQGIELLRMPVI